MAFNEKIGVPESELNKPIKVSDAIDILIEEINNKLPKESIDAIKARNRWVKEVILPLFMEKATEGFIPANECMVWLQIVSEGLEIREYMKLRDRLPRAGESLHFWVGFFEECTADTLTNCGIFTVTLGWTFVTSELKRVFAEQKYESIYSLSDDPKDWINTIINDPAKGAVKYPFWDQRKFERIAKLLGAFMTHNIKK